MRLPCLGFSETDIQKLISGANKKSIPYYEAFGRAKEFFVSANGIEQIDTLISAVKHGIEATRYEKPTTVLYGFLETVGYLEYLMKEEQKENPEVTRQIQYLTQFFDLMSAYEKVTPGAHVLGFVEHFDHILESGDAGKIFQPRDTAGSIQVLTVHGSKGLEYPYVFIVNCVEERFPTRDRSSGIELPLPLIKETGEGKEDFHIEEERRLFYVAITRAKEQVFFTSADYYSEERKRKKKISRFVEELQLEKNVALPKITTTELSKFKKQPPRKPTAQVYEIPKTFSHSQIMSFLNCP